MTEKTNGVINDFIRITEHIANGKTNRLDFGSPNMTFYRGEIHILKMTGDYPGIFISEIARSFNITRAVVAKTVGKLKERGYLTKEEDPRDKKRLRLFLTDKGREAYRLHEEYHLEYDRPLFDYLEGLNERELETIQAFLRHAGKVVENHF